MSQADSQISHVLFRKEDGWTPSKGARWIESHLDRAAPQLYDEVHSEGGEKLKPGEYVVYRLRGGGNASRYAYGEELESFPGVFFKFGFGRKGQ